jgi:hypothetical protein
MADSQRELVAAIKEQVRLEGRAHDLETLRLEFEMYRSVGRMDEANRVLALVTEFRRARQEVTVQAGQDSSVVEEAVMPPPADMPPDEVVVLCDDGVNGLIGEDEKQQE